MENLNNISSKTGHLRLAKYTFLVLVFALGFGCQKDDPVDEREPTIQVEDIENNETKEAQYSSEGYPINFIIADNAGLSSYTVEVDSASVNVFSYTSTEFSHKLEHKSITLDNLSTNYLYDVTISVTDINSHSTSFEFKLKLNDFIRYEYLGLVGDATLAGWNPGASEAMQQDPDDPAIFTYSGPLSANGEGAFKIATFTGDWCDGEWFYASEPNRTITEQDNYVVNDCGGPDNKWQVTEETQGNYLITVNLRDRTIDFEQTE